MPKAKSFRFRTNTRIVSLLVVLLHAVFLVGAIWIFFVKAQRPTDYAWGVAAIAIFGGVLRKALPQALHSISYRLDVSDDWVAVRDLFSLVVIPFSKLSRFAEHPMEVDGRLSGYQFVFQNEEGDVVGFSSQIVGWAEIICLVRQAVPDRIPPPEELDSYSILRSLELDPDAASLSAPPYDIDHEWRSPSIARWYDYWAGWLFALITLWYPAQWLMGMLREEGLKTSGVFIAVPVLVGSGQLLALLIASLLRRRRSRSRSSAPQVPTIHGKN
ncbi:MAG: hypothetical protein H3C27_01765 [Opitutaceae bacterium]|nr:hypothetical protein [Opitutaceae bacterium]